MHARRLMPSIATVSLLVAVGCTVVYTEPYPTAATTPPPRVTTTPPPPPPQQEPPRTVVVPTTVVPSLIGHTLQVCEAVLIRSQLKVGEVGYQRSMQPMGTVIAQEPPAGSAVSPGSRISVTLAIDASRAVVPNVLGKSPEEAAQIIHIAGLTSGEVTYVDVPDATTPRVGAQFPAAGTQVDRSSAVSLIVHAASPAVVVPDLTGLRQADAAARLEERELYISEITSENHPTMVFGVVIAQTPFPGSQVEPGTPVRITLSAGAGQVSVPNVVGLMAHAGISEMLKYGLQSRLEYQSRPGIPNQIMRQFPAAGAAVAPETTVILYVSQRTVTTLLIVPSVVGQPAAEANAIIAASGLTLGDITYAPGRSGVVLEQDPPADTTVERGTRVSYVLGRRQAQRLVRVPNLVGLNQNRAEDALRALNLSVGTVTEVRGPVNGQVRSQSPVGGKTVAVGTAVDLEVSVLTPVARRVIVPDIVGMDRAIAENALRQAGLEVGAIQEITGVRHNVVASQLPAANTRVPGGTQVSLTVYARPVVSRMVTVPNLVAKTLGQAEAIIRKADLVVGQITETTGWQQNRVMAQSPTAGSRAAAGTLVDLTVSRRQGQPAKVTVPNVIGLQQDQAEARIMEAGLEVGNVAEVAGAAPGRVLSQNPGAGTQVNEDTKINLTVGEQRQQLDLVVVPNVTGMSQGQAEARIRQVGLVVGQITEQQGQQQNKVVSQSPQAGTQAVKGSPVDLVVTRKQAEAQTVTVPNVMGMPQGQAEARIRQAGLTVGQIAEVQGDQQGRVQSQSPAAGAVVPPATAVNLTVSRKRADAEQVVVPDLVGMTRGQAEAKIRNAGLTVGTVTSVDGDKPDRVQSQTPGAGARVDAGSSVDFAIAARGGGGARATTVPVPSVRGMSLREARKAITDAGLRVGRAKRSPGARGTTVRGTDPGEGTNVARGTSVDIIF
jgi:beta-lactam-binding protein with PASTA domain